MLHVLKRKTCVTWREIYYKYSLMNQLVQKMLHVLKRKTCVTWREIY